MLNNFFKKLHTAYYKSHHVLFGRQLSKKLCFVSCGKRSLKRGGFEGEKGIVGDVVLYVSVIPKVLSTKYAVSLLEQLFLFKSKMYRNHTDSRLLLPGLCF